MRASELKNSLFNLLGMFAPLLAAIFSFPILLEKMGGEVFGWLIIIWTVVGYFSLFDLGISRALTRILAIELTADPQRRDLSIIWSGIILLLMLGILAGVIIISAKDYLFFKDSSNSSQLLDVVNSAQIVGLTLPFVLISSGCIAVLEVYGRFRLLSVLRAGLGISTLLIPLPVYELYGNLFSVSMSLLIVRFIFCTFYIIYALIPHLAVFKLRISVVHIKDFVRYGTWITLSNVIGPLMLYGDRALIAMFTGVAAAGYYGSANEVLSKVLIVPSAILGVYFPIFAKSSTDNGLAKEKLKQAIYFNGIAVTLIVAFLMLAGPKIAEIWMGSDFALAFNQVYIFMLIGIFFNSTALITQGFVQAMNRPDLTAKLHILEVVLYINYAVWLITTYSLRGAAMALAIRTSLSCFALFWLSFYLLKKQDS